MQRLLRHINCSRIELIRLNSNFIEKLESGTFAGTGTAFNRIDLSKNRINNIEDSAFASATIDILDLNNNKLKSINAETFHRITITTSFFAAFNQLEEIPAAALQAIKYSCRPNIPLTIDLSDNFITSLTSAQLSFLNNIRDCIYVQFSITNNLITKLTTGSISSITSDFLDLDMNPLNMTEPAAITNVTLRGLNIMLNPGGIFAVDTLSSWNNISLLGITINEQSFPIFQLNNYRCFQHNLPPPNLCATLRPGNTISIRNTCVELPYSFE